MIKLPFGKEAVKIITIQDIAEAKKRIEPYFHRSPLLYSARLSDNTGGSVYLKLENLNETGSFKIRGAMNRLLCLSDEEKSRGVTTFSTGNFGRSIGYFAKRLGIDAVICISSRVPRIKVEALKQTGAQIAIIGDSQDEAEKHCHYLQRKHGLTVVHPFDDKEVIAGQGTIGLEILDELPEVDMAMGGLSGGGLHAGLGIALKTIDPAIQLIGLSPSRSAAMYKSLQAGQPVIVDELDSLADSLLGGIGLNNQFTFKLVQKYVDQLLLMEEQEIAAGMAFMLREHGMIIEGAAAVGIGAILHNRIKACENMVIVVTGSNADRAEVLRIAEKDQPNQAK